MHTIDVAGYGWAHGRFYPPDLPVEWRLGYYANEFAAVVIPAVVWASATPPEAAAWGEEVDDAFRFYWEVVQNDAVRVAHLAQLLPPLAAKSGGVVGHGAPAAELRELLGPLGIPLGRWPQHDELTYGAGLAVALAAPQPRELRTQLEQMGHGACRAGLLVCDTPDTLRQAKLVAQLLGVSRSA